MREAKDKAGKWLIDHCGDSILHMAGIRGFERWRSVQAQLVQQSRIPDGLVEIFFPGVKEPDLVLLEIYAYPRNDIEDDILRDLCLVFLDRGKVPEVVTVILHPHGKVQVTGRVEKISRLQTTALAGRWQVIEMWKLLAEELLQSQDVGLIPWAILGKFDGPPPALLQQCKKRIEQQAPAAMQQPLLAARQFLASLCYDKNEIKRVLGGIAMAVEWTDFPIVRDYLESNTAQVVQEGALGVLEDRFDKVPEDLAILLRTIKDEKELGRLLRYAAKCPSLESFRERLQQSIPSPS